MAFRPAWTLRRGRVVCREFEFTWNGGFAVSQKRKNITGLHQAILDDTGEKALEISTKGTEPLGNELSAFNLTLGGRYIENIFQAAKQYENGGPYLDLLDAAPKDAKRDPRHTSSGRLVAFNRDGELWSLEPRTAFYDHIYVTAVCEKFGTGLDLSQYQWFTDIEFNPKRSVNCQARAAAIYKLLQETDGFDVLTDRDKWLEFHRKLVLA